MKKFFFIVLILLMTMTANAQNKLTERQLLLCACASLEAQGDMQRLDSAIRKALDGGVTVNELKEAFSQLYAYTGFPRSLNALGTLQKVLSDRKANGINDNEGKPWMRPELWDDAGKAVRKASTCLRISSPTAHHLSLSDATTAETASSHAKTSTSCRLLLPVCRT